MESTSSGRVDLVLPAYNEAVVLEHSVRRLADAIPVHGAGRWRIVIVDNGSTDQTPDLGRRLAERVPFVQFLRLEAKGRGGALRCAWNTTDADLSLYMDVDLSTDLAAVPLVVEELQEGADVVTGSRLHHDARTTRCLKRELLSRGYNRLVQWLLRTRSFDDAQCGFKGVRVRSVRPLLPIASIAGLATATRAVGAALAIAAAYHAWERSDSWRQAAARWVYVFPLAAWGLLAYMAFQWWTFGNPVASVQTQQHWHLRPPVGAWQRFVGLLSWEPVWSVYTPSLPGYFII